jgi:hypothetical protein
LAQTLSFWWFGLRTDQTKNSLAGTRCKKSSWVHSFNQSQSHKRSEMWVSVFNGFWITWKGVNPALCR